MRILRVSSVPTGLIVADFVHASVPSAKLCLEDTVANTKGKKKKRGAKTGRNCYVTPAFSGGPQRQALRAKSKVIPNKGEQNQKWLTHSCLLRGPKEGGNVPIPNSRGHATKHGLQVPNPNSRGHATKHGLQVPNPNSRGHTKKRGLQDPNPNSRGHATKRGL